MANTPRNDEVELEQALLNSMNAGTRQKRFQIAQGEDSQQKRVRQKVMSAHSRSSTGIDGLPPQPVSSAGRLLLPQL